MKNRIFLLPLLIILAVFLTLSGYTTTSDNSPKDKPGRDRSQAQQTSHLRVGKFMTPEEGKAFLDSLASTYHNKEEWNERVQTVRLTMN